MLFKDRKELADKYKIWVKQSIDNNKTMILDCAESLIAFLDLNGYMNKAIHGEWIYDGVVTRCSNCGDIIEFDDCQRWDSNYCPNCGADMRGGTE